MLKMAILIGVSGTVGAIVASKVANTKWATEKFSDPKKALNKDTLKAGTTAAVGVTTFAVLRSLT